MDPIREALYYGVIRPFNTLHEQIYITMDTTLSSLGSDYANMAPFISSFIVAGLLYTPFLLLLLCGW
jgi:hypothetical protein